MKKLLIIIALAVSSLSAKAQISSVYTQQFQHYLDSVGKKFNVKGMSAAILIPNEGIWTGAYGESEAGVPITTDMYLPIGSNTKTFTAAVILKLQEQGLLNINDPIDKWITHDSVDGTVTVKQLLSHRSGLADYTVTYEFFDAFNSDYHKVWQAEEMLQFLRTPVAAPGTQGVYNNTNFLLLGIIVKKITGKEIHEAYHDMVMNPQNLTHTFFYPHKMPPGIIPHGWSNAASNAAQEDMMVDYGYSNVAFLSMASGSGAIVSTAEDNVKFWNALMNGQIVNTATLNMMKDAHPIDRGIVYGLGLMKKTTNQRETYSHGGTCFGYSNENLYDVQKGVSIAILTNQDSLSNSRLYEFVRGLHQIVINMPPTTVFEVTHENQVKLYPNPANGMVQLDAGNITGNYEIRDMMGRLVASGEVKPGVHTLSLTGVAKGIYTVRVSDKGTPAYTGKLLVN